MTSHITGASEDAKKRMAELMLRDPEVGALAPRDDVIAAMQRPGASYADVIRTVMEGYADRPALGVRDEEIRSGADGRRQRHFLPRYRTISYAELGGQIDMIAACWQNESAFAVRPGDCVAMLSFTGAQMLACDLACAYVQAIAVPLQANLGQPEMDVILRDTAPTCLIINIENLELGLSLATRQDSIRSVIVIDANEGDDGERERVAAARTLLRDAGIACATFDEAMAMGARTPFVPLPRSPEADDAVRMIIYTSGSTGTPKGAIIHEAILLWSWIGLAAYQPTVAMAYAPMNHFAGRNQIVTTLAQGGTAYISLRSDLSTLLDDIRLGNPTTLFLLPRICEVIYQHHQTELQRRIALGEPEAEADAAVRAEMRAGYLGTRLLMATTGSSPTAPEVRAFIGECFDIPFVEGYGCTEAGSGVASGGRVQRRIVEDYKLRDVPELGYYSTDKPHPRGELLVKTSLQIKGYFKQPEATAAIFDEHGYIVTGDIVEELGPDRIEWVDRRNSVIKLSQAEFVAIGPLEAAILGNSALIKQIYVYGSSYRAFLLAVVVPDVEVAETQLGRTPSDAELESLVMDDLRKVARVAGLKSFEVPRGVIIEHEAFSLENGLLSSLRKPLRPNLKRRYGDALEAMYQEMDRVQQQELAQLRVGEGDADTAQRVAAAIRAHLGLTAVDPQGPLSYRDLGGDSLGAVALAALLDEMFDVDIPVSMILGPDGTVRRLAGFIDRIRAGETGQASFAAVHGIGATHITADQLTLSAFLGADVLAAAEQAAQPQLGMPGCVLLTGVTGFLGRFLCIEWLERMAATGGRVIALVRASDHAAARQRLFDVIGQQDQAAAARFAQLADKHLEVLAADLGTPDFGLDADTFARLADSVERIVHPGALVIHRLSYEDLFGPNVAGTAELLRLALTSRQKPIDYVSTVGVPHVIPGLAHTPENFDVRLPDLRLELKNSYAFGYAASKWAGEVLMRDAHDRFGLPVTVFRPSMILGHSQHAGQINVPDMFIRLLCSIVMTGLAPASFYQPGADGKRARVHYDGTPVDVLAKAMVEIGLQGRNDYRSFNTLNYHYDDDVSLDSFVDWIISAGYEVHRVADYAQWLDRFESKLRQLPEAARRHSAIEVLESYGRPIDAKEERADTSRYQEALAAQDGFVMPHLGEALIHKYLRDMVLHELISDAGRMAA